MRPNPRRAPLRPMPHWQRGIVHELAKHYHLLTGSYGNEPTRRVDIFRTTLSGWPGMRLSAALAVQPGAAQVMTTSSH